MPRELLWAAIGPGSFGDLYFLASRGADRAVERKKDSSDEPASDLSAEAAASPCRACSPREASPEGGGGGTSSLRACLGCSASCPFPSGLLLCLRAALVGEADCRRREERFLWQPCDSLSRVFPLRIARLLTCDWLGRAGRVPPGLLPFLFRPQGPREACRRSCRRRDGSCRGRSSTCSFSRAPRPDPAALPRR